MCTLSFIPTRSGYRLAMNRDDAVNRPEAEPPAVFRHGGVAAVYPQERPAGTWIAANEFGVSFALLNWDRPKSGPKRQSRGGVIPAVISCPFLANARSILAARELGGAWPFRLFGFFGPERLVREWRWDGAKLAALAHPWEHKHWFSSGLSDREAARRRQPLCDSALRLASSETLAWLRRVHRMHGDAPGPFSICVHRPDAATLSYTEISVGPRLLLMRYSPGQPCRTRLTAGRMAAVRLPIRAKAHNPVAG